MDSDFEIPKGIVLFEKNPVDDYPWNDDIFLAYSGFCSMNYKTQGIYYKDLPNIIKITDLNINEEDVICVVGSIRFTRRLCRLLNKTYPEGLDYPEELILFRHREINKCSISEAYKRIESQLKISEELTEPLFIKPYLSKQFYTQIIKNKKDFIDFTLINAEKYSGWDLCWVSTLLPPIKSEWRNYVYKGQLVESKCYQGDFKVFPDYDIVEDMIKTYKSSPTAYGLDVAVTEDKLTTLIEVNPAISLGNYGLDSNMQANMILTSWNELPKNTVDIG